MISDIYWTAQQASEVWGISSRRVSKLCEENRIAGAEFTGNSWFIPIGTERPADARTRDDFLSHQAAKPFVKWAGGKGQLLNTLAKAYPKQLGDTITKFAEPFVGGGAVLFDVLNRFPGIEEAYISDINTELITTYRVVRDNVDELIDRLDVMQQHHISADTDTRKAYYLKNRERYNNQMLLKNSDPVEVASLFIYLNKTCFNGLYRVNSKGLFNVPSGVYKNPLICNESNLRNVSEKLQKVRIENLPYAESRSFIDENTFVYFDPPYRPLTESSSFTSYTEMSFDDNDQRQLADFVHTLCKNGAFVAVSNSDPKNVNPNDEFFDELYEFANIHRVKANRMINSNGAGRGKINELLITNYEFTTSEEIVLDCFYRRSLSNFF